VSTFDSVRESIATHAQNTPDYRVPSTAFTVLHDGKISLADQLFETAAQYHMTEYARSKMLQRLDVPKRGFDKLIDLEGSRDNMLQSIILGYKLHNHYPDLKWLVRTRQDTVRAFLSDRFQPFDHMPFMDALLHPDTGIQTQAQVHRFRIGEFAEDLYLKLVFPDLTVERNGETYKTGVTYWNGELGNRSIGCAPFIYRLECTNDLIVQSEHAIRQTHVGTLRPNIISAILADATIRMLEEAISNVDRLEDLRNVPIPNLTKEIAALKNKYRLGEKQLAQVEAFTLEDVRDDPSAFEFVNAMTRLARQQKTEDARIDLETVAGKELVRLHKRL